MSYSLILLAAGNSKRFSHRTPKPFIKIAGRTILNCPYLNLTISSKLKTLLLLLTKNT